MSISSIDSTRRSWNVATRNHNAHKGDQAAFLKGGGDVLFPEERALLGPLAGKSLVHLQCNSGQDSLCLARDGAAVTGVDLSDEAIGFAKRLSKDSGIPARFIEAEVVTWLSSTEERFDLAFASYGVIGWNADAASWIRGMARVLKPGGRFVYVEFHPLIWSYGQDLALTGDDYFARGPFIEPVKDYVAESGAALGGQSGAMGTNDVPSYSYQYTLGELVTFLCSAGLELESLTEYPYSNGFRPYPTMIEAPGRRWVWPEGKARLPLMFSVVARKPG
jgi:SAM-dependent methyltransferase